jgi:transposase
MLVAERAARLAAETEAQYRALLIEKLKSTIKKLRHEHFGQSSERGALLETADTGKITVPSFERRKHLRWTSTKIEATSCRFLRALPNIPRR